MPFVKIIQEEVKMIIFRPILYRKELVNWNNVPDPKHKGREILVLHLAMTLEVSLASL